MARLLRRTLLASALCAAPAFAADSTPAPAPAPVSAAAPASPPSPLVWKGTSGGFALTWTNAELSATNATGAQIYSAKEISSVDFKDYEDTCEGYEAFVLLSAVGPLLSVRQTQTADCAGTAHPSAITLVNATDLNDPKKTPSLADYFEEADLYAALVGDGLVKKTLAAANLPAPKTSHALLKLLAANSNECEYRFEKDSLRHFAFHHLEKGKVAVRIGLPYGCEAARGNLTQLGLLLPIPAKLKDALEAAAARKEGFLMKDDKAVAKDQTAQFSFSEKPLHPKP